MENAVREKRFKEADKIQNDINSICSVEQLRIDLKNAINEGRYKDAADLDGKIKKVYSNLNVKSDIKEPLTSDENLHIAFLKSKIDENLANKNYASAAENQSTLTNLENWTKELQKAVDEKRYADASSLDGKI